MREIKEFTTFLYEASFERKGRKEIRGKKPGLQELACFERVRVRITGSTGSTQNVCKHFINWTSSIVFLMHQNLSLCFYGMFDQNFNDDCKRVITGLLHHPASRSRECIGSYE